MLTVRLPQAATARVRMVSRLSALDLMGMVRWCEQELAGDELDRVIGAMKDNRCWLTTPWHDIELVHAVQHPLEVPQSDEFRGVPLVGPDLRGRGRHGVLDGRSTEKVDLDATWTEPGRRPARGRPARAVRPHDRLQPADGRVGARPGGTSPRPTGCATAGS